MGSLLPQLQTVAEICDKVRPYACVLFCLLATFQRKLSAPGLKMAKIWDKKDHKVAKNQNI
jgi:hypothetical protein